MLYYSLVYPYLSYCNLVWGKKFATHLKSLEVLQKRFIRIIHGTPSRAHTSPLFFYSCILKLEDIYRLKLASYMYQLPDFEQFQFEHGHATRNRGQLRPEFQRLSVTQQAITFQGPREWNRIPSDLKNLTSICKFKK